ncbi:hypothetical protein HYH03_004321 [Edaphochlamys debaryana]|uniref:Flagellar associated protein n=1 Tax=Edaphochlamys debaryana TaxID=47281 RepID=A0A836C284_9CHLO|nr:hypothetical protein HYH03_004321 [Edaphochlamys debaryana]|eukprot:KAG2497575.1 hypothetical protein HYH03_004321 [Edaphochlamys debaryana]
MTDMVHKGPNQAGNKSMLSYNSVTGIPGYTGYTPSGATLQVPVKGFQHTGRPAATGAVESLTVQTLDPKKTTQYQDDYLKKPSDTAAFSKTGGGYWISQRTLPPHTAFTGTTTYRKEVCDGERTAAQQVARSEGLACTLVQYEAARQAGEVRRSISAEPRIRADQAARGLGTQTVVPGGRPGSGPSILEQSGPRSPQASSSVMASSSRRPATTPNTYGELPGYQTTYGNMTDKLARTQAEVTLAGGPNCGPVGDPRFKTLPRVMVPGMGRTYTTYSAEYGPDGHDPMARQAADKATMTRAATTRDLAHGTTRNACHVPRYTGHIPASQYASAQGVAHGEAAEPRPDHKARALLFTLDQYPRDRLPGYTGYKPQAPGNVASGHVNTEPSLRTTAGEAGLRGTAFGVPHEDHTHHINSRAGLMTFFNTSQVGTEFVSDNGLFNAQVYWKDIKSQGKLGMRTGIPSKMTDYGAPFRAAASMV